jgi:para-nitrobenzyl esterase
MQKKLLPFQWIIVALSWVILISVLAVIIGCSSSGNSTFNTTVTTAFGDVKGSAENNALVWKGIPYAKPPLGALRWKAPVDPDAWTGVLEATTPCSACSQQVTDKFWRPSAAFTGGEDCLCLDIYRPESDTTGLPVFVWIHGGANVLGSAQVYNGTALATRGNIIVVIIQYRLNTLGWLRHHALRTSGTAEDQSGNYGTLDTMKALAWVQNNITAFGGDPTNVTVGGQSAGGAHVMNLIISPLANNFQKAFAESPALSEVMPLRTVDEGDIESDAILLYLLTQDGRANDFNTITDPEIEAYLRSKTAEEILRAALYGPGAPYGPQYASMPVPKSFADGTVLPEAVTTDLAKTLWLDTITSGNFKKVPLIIGNTRYEFKDLMTLSGSALKAFNIPSGANSWSDLYSVLDGTMTLNDVLPTPTDQLEYEKAGLLKSRKWQAECNGIARAIKTNNPSNTVYSYYFTWAGGEDPALADFKFIFGAAHGQDVPFFFGDPTDLFKGYSFTTANQAGRVALQEAMMDYLTSFVKTGDPTPSGSTLPNWAQWSNTGGESKFIKLDADLSSTLISMDSTETTASIVSDEITAVLNANSEFAFLFGLPGFDINP